MLQGVENGQWELARIGCPEGNDDKRRRAKITKKKKKSTDGLKRERSPVTARSGKGRRQNLEENDGDLKEDRKTTERKRNSIPLAEEDPEAGKERSRSTERERERGVVVLLQMTRLLVVRSRVLREGRRNKEDRKRREAKERKRDRGASLILLKRTLLLSLCPHLSSFFSHQPRCPLPRASPRLTSTRSTPGVRLSRTKKKK